MSSDGNSVRRGGQRMGILKSTRSGEASALLSTVDTIVYCLMVVATLGGVWLLRVLITRAVLMARIREE